jgi:hypothetical protein
MEERTTQELQNDLDSILAEYDEATLPDEPTPESDVEAAEEALTENLEDGIDNDSAPPEGLEELGIDPMSQQLAEAQGRAGEYESVINEAVNERDSNELMNHAKSRLSEFGVTISNDMLEAAILKEAINNPALGNAWNERYKNTSNYQNEVARAIKKIAADDTFKIDQNLTNDMLSVQHAIKDAGRSTPEKIDLNSMSDAQFFEWEKSART